MKVNSLLKSMVDSYIIPKLRKGDIIMIGTYGNLISWLIKKFTNSFWSHTGIYIGNGEWIEATFPKVKISTIYELVAEYSYRKFEVYRLKKRLTEEEYDKVIETAKKQLGKRYDILGDIGHALSIIFGKKYFLKQVEHRDKFYCSELVGRAFAEVGIYFNKEKGWHITPQDIVDSDLVEKVLNFM